MRGTFVPVPSQSQYLTMHKRNYHEITELKYRFERHSFDSVIQQVTSENDALQHISQIVSKNNDEEIVFAPKIVWM